MLSKKEVRRLYGKDAVVSRRGSYLLVHLDKPSPELVRQRTREFNPDSYFSPDCPLCEMLKEGGVVVYDDSMCEGDADILE
jgi:hypothetical protein